MILILLMTQTACVVQTAGPGKAHPALADYREKTAKWLEGEPRSVLQRIEPRDTDGANTRDLAYLAADRAVRLFAPIALETTEPVEPALKLRDLNPLSNEPLAQAALNDGDTELAAAYLRATQNLPPGHYGKGPGQQCSELALRQAVMSLVTALSAGKVAKPSESREVAGKAIDLSAQSAATAFKCVFETYQAIVQAGRSSGKAPDQALLQEVLAKRIEIERAAVELLDDLVLLARGRKPVHVPLPAARGGVVHHKEDCNNPAFDPDGRIDYRGCYARAQQQGQYADVIEWCEPVTASPESMPLERIDACWPNLISAHYLSGDEQASVDLMAVWCGLPEAGKRARRPSGTARTERAAQAACAAVVALGPPISMEDELGRTERLQVLARFLAKPCRSGKNAVLKVARKACEASLRMSAE